MNLPKLNTGYTLALGSALAYTGFDVGVKALLHELTVWGMLFLRGLIGLAIAALAARYYNRRLWGRHSRLLIAAGVFLFFSSVCNAVSMTSIPLYQALIILYLYPIITMLLAVPVNREPISAGALKLAGLAFVGCVFLIWPDEAAGLSFSPGHVVGLGGAFLYSLGQVCVRMMGNDNTGLEPIFFYGLVAVTLCWPMSQLFGTGMGLDNARGFSVGLALAAAGLAAQLMGFAAIRFMPAYKVGLIGLLELLAGSLLSWLVFHDPMSLRAMGGGFLIVFVALRLRHG